MFHLIICNSQDLSAIEIEIVGILTTSLAGKRMGIKSKQQIFTCSKAKIETLENGVKYVQS